MSIDDSDDRSVARARVDALVGEIAALMASGDWVAGETVKVLASREGVTVSAVEKWSAAAGRLLRMTQDPKEIAAKRAQNCGRLDEVYAMALDNVVIDRESNVHLVPDIRGAVAAVAEQNKLLGLITEKHEVRGVTENQVNDMMATVMRVLERFPEAREALLEELRLKKGPEAK